MISEITTASLDELIEGINTLTGYDFSRYSKASLKRRVRSALESFEMTDLGELSSRLDADRHFRESFVEEITVNVTEMFRNPAFFRSMRESVIPSLATYPYLKIWNAGCSSGEEMFSFAILFDEAGILDRCTFYGTDINQEMLARAREGIYDHGAVEEYEENYQRSGGPNKLSDYYTRKHGRVKMCKRLGEKMVFGLHNLVTDGSFNEFNLIVCRNVLIYFEKELQDRVVHLFHESMPILGYLGLGNKESLRFCTAEAYFESTDKDERIFRKIG